jgi:hypothetical protein
MASYYYTASRGNGTTLFLAPLTDSHIAAAGQELPDTSGHFLFERDDKDPSEIRIIAQVLSDDAVFELRCLLNMD